MTFAKCIQTFLTKVFSKDPQPYLEEIGIDAWPGNNWGRITSMRALRKVRRFRKTKKKTGVDPRDCFHIDWSLYMWIYTHICQFEKDCGIDLGFWTFEHNGKKYTQREYMLYLKKLLTDLLCFDEIKDCPHIIWNNADGEQESSDEEKRKFMDTWTKNYNDYESTRREMFDVLYELLPHLWW